MIGYNNSMPRPKTQTDEQVLEAALALVRRGGTGALTFAALAGHCGLSPATLVQRFGTRSALTQRTLLHAWDRLQAQTLELAAAVSKTPEGAVELLVGLSDHDGDVEAHADSLLILREDLRDPALRSRGATWEATLVSALAECFTAVPGAPSEIAFALAAHWQGAIIWWAFAPQRHLGDYLAESLRTLVGLLLRAPAR